MTKASEYKRERDEAKAKLELREEEAKIKDLLITSQKALLLIKEETISALTSRLQDLNHRREDLT